MAIPRRKGPGGGNRWWLLVLGIVLLLAGAAGVTLAFNLANPLLSAVGAPPVAPEPSADLGGGQVNLPTAGWVGVAVGGVVVFLLGLVWLIGQVPRPVPRSPFRLHTDPKLGTTTIAASALEQVFGSELDSVPGVVGSSVDIRGAATEPVVEARVTVNERADVQQVLRGLEEGPIKALATSLDGKVSTLRVFLDVSSRTRSEDAVQVA